MERACNPLQTNRTTKVAFVLNYSYVWCMGMHKSIDSPETLFNLFIEYRDLVKAQPFTVKDWVGKNAFQVERDKEKPLTMEGFENYVAEIDGMPHELIQYFSNRDQRYSEFVPICSRIKRAIRQDQIEGGMAGIYNPSITQRLNGLAEKVEATVSDTDIDFDKLSDAALEEINNARR